MSGTWGDNYSYSIQQLYPYGSDHLYFMTPESNEPHQISTRYSEANELTDSKLLVENRTFHVSKSVLMLASPVFRAMFSERYREGQTCDVPLPGKKAEDIQCMLDYIYPDIETSVTAKSALQLLPLAEEYQLAPLRHECVDVLMKQEKYPLEAVTLSEQFSLPALMEKAIDYCASKLPVFSEYSQSMDGQLGLPENSSLSKDAQIRIYRAKILLARKKILQLIRRRRSNADLNSLDVNWL